MGHLGTYWCVLVFFSSAQNFIIETGRCNTGEGQLRVWIHHPPFMPLNPTLFTLGCYLITATETHYFHPSSLNLPPGLVVQLTDMFQSYRVNTTRVMLFSVTVSSAKDEIHQFMTY